jgi:hypothetical protein
MNVVENIIKVTDKASEQITQASGLVSKSNGIAMSVASAMEQQSITTSGIAQSSEKLRQTVQGDIEKGLLLSEESENVKTASSSMERSIACFT